MRPLRTGECSDDGYDSNKELNDDHDAIIAFPR